MKPFLQIVTQDIVRKYGTNLSDVCVVSSNQRASLFMNQYLVDIVGKPVFSPQYLSVGELFRSKSPLMVADDIRAIHTLYGVYQKIVKADESIDAFWGWGEVLLNDFNDIDKHLGHVETILSNVRDLHAFDTTDYLTDENKKLLSQFFAEFSADHDTKLKERFRLLWNNLLPIYHGFNQALKEKNLTYEGAMYREVALRADDIDWGDKKYIFIGFNMLLETEQRLFSALRKKGLAHFYWDYDRYYTSDTTQEAGTYIRQYMDRYPNELPNDSDGLYDNLSREKDITYLSAASEDIQAQYVGEWLKENHRTDTGQTTAIVLADVDLLKSVLCHLPQDVSSKVNIAMGMPLSATLAKTFVDNFLRLHIYNFNLRERAFVSRQVRTLLNHPYTSLLVGEDTALTSVMDNPSYVVEADSLCQDEAMSLLFSPIDTNREDANLMLIERLRTLLENIGKVLGSETLLSYEEQMKQESVYKMYTLLNPLYDIISKKELIISPTTLLRLIDQMVGRTTMPFHGEPIADLQITGVLETRNLDFDHVLVLSCNEGNIPKGAYNSSFIPYVVRHAHGLTTPEERMAVEAYYFYHLVQRCSDLSFAFNSSTEDGKTGQMSRFMLQLMADEKSTCHPRQMLLTSQQMPYSIPNVVKKTPNVMKILDAKTSLSPSAINTYLRCPVKFYYRYVAGVEEPDSTSIDDGRTFGNIFHLAAEAIYTEAQDHDKRVTPEAISRILMGKGQKTILQRVEDAICHEVFHDRPIHYDGLLLITRDVLVHYVNLLLKTDSQCKPFYVEGLEKKIYENIPVNVDGRLRQIEVGGLIDRLDRIELDDGQEVLRVLDYKTGNSKMDTINNVEEIFDPGKIENHSDYFLQAMFYSMLVRHSQQPYSHRGEVYPPLNSKNLAVRPAVLFVKKEESRHNPMLRFGSNTKAQPINDVLDYEDEFRSRLCGVIADILSADKPFTPTPYTDRCESCAFIRMCQGNDTTPSEE